MMATISKLFTINDFRFTKEFEVEVYADIEEGGSNRYGSDEPEWIECLICNIYNPETNKPVSDRLYDALVSEYSKIIEEEMLWEYSHGL